MNITISETRDIDLDDILILYKANRWSSAEKPTQLYNGLLNSETLITAWECYFRRAFNGLLSAFISASGLSGKRNWQNDC